MTEKLRAQIDGREIHNGKGGMDEMNIGPTRAPAAVHILGGGQAQVLGLSPFDLTLLGSGASASRRICR